MGKGSFDSSLAPTVRVERSLFGLGAGCAKIVPLGAMMLVRRFVDAMADRVIWLWTEPPYLSSL
jgi:hypothetical protein